MVRKNLLASILINNYNNELFIKKSIKSCLNQTYKNFEIIIYDDASNDKSKIILKEINNKKIKIIFNKKKKYKTGALNQFKAIREAFNNSKGEVIFLLDGDDFFLKNKIEYFIKIFDKNKELNFMQDNPIYFYPSKNLKIKKKLNKKKFIIHTWPYFNPTSTMVFRRDFLKKLINNIKFSNKKFERMFFDARAFIYIYFFSREYDLSNQYLTIYTQNKKGDTYENYRKKNFNWWKRRFQYHKYIEALFLKNKKKHIKLIDYYVTLTICWILKQIIKIYKI